jgi:hypothetical protein
MQLTRGDMSFPENSCQGFHKGLPFEVIGGQLEELGVCQEVMQGRVDLVVESALEAGMWRWQASTHEGPRGQL